MLERLLKKRSELDDTVALIEPEANEERRFSDLERESDSVASSLKSFGIGKGDRVATLINRPIFHVELFFALRKVGASLVPLNFVLKKESLQAQIQATKPKLVIDDFFGFGIESSKVVYGASKDYGGGSSFSIATASSALEDEAMVLFTGGSTGLPKGAMIHERSIVWNSINTILSWALSKDDIAYQPFPLYHTGGWNIFLLPLFHVGGKVVLSAKFEAGTTIQALHDYHATRFVGVPTILYRIACDPKFQEVDLSHVLFGAGGGAMNEELVTRFTSKNYRIFQGYGATETGPNNFYISPERFRAKIGSVGKPMLFVEAKLSQEGELLIKGPHTFKGYLGTESKMAFDEEGFFHSGDLFAIDSEGDYRFVGRTKDMIKTGGENVYSSEVEEAINALPYVNESAVIGITDQKWGEIVLAVVVLKTGGQADEEGVKNDLKQKLPSFKVPKRVVFVKELPKSELGKVQKYLLRDLYEKSVH
jgi:fatty-acyl-CoA synthase